VKNFADLSKNTPLFDCIGLTPSADRPSNTVCSYWSIEDNLSAKAKSYAQKYQQFVIEYVVEWEKVVTQRINAGLKSSEEMRRDLDHYRKKVEDMRLSANKIMAKGKQVNKDAATRLQRNEEKLIAAKQNYNRTATDVCILMEEITERSWRDLHPMLIKCAQFDMTLSGDQAQILSQLAQVVHKLKDIATANGISPQPRLKDLANLKPELLSTKPGGDFSGLTITDGGLGGSFSPTTSSTNGLSPTSTFSFGGTMGGGGGGTGMSSLAAPPGSVAPQGMGGFPVMVGSPPAAAPAAASSSNNFHRTGSVSSYHSEPPISSMGMLSMSTGTSAPAPTMDDLYSANNMNSGAARTAPNSGNFGGGGGAYPTVRSSSFNDAGMYGGRGGGGGGDADSVHSGYSNSNYSAYSQPPMSAPPPPPSMPPPPPPGGGGMGMSGMNGGMYNGGMQQPPLPMMSNSMVPSPMGNSAPYGGSSGIYNYNAAPPPMNPPPMMNTYGMQQPPPLGGGAPPRSPASHMAPQRNTNPFG
jgi:hypothetical protein